MSDNVYHCEVRAEKYKGSLSTLTKTGKFYYRPPFKVKASEVGHHAPPYRFDNTAIQQLNTDAQFIDRRGDRWTRIA